VPSETQKLFVDNGLCYSYEESIRWLDNPKSYPKGFKITLFRLSDFYNHGEVQPVNAFPVSVPYSNLLHEPCNEILKDYLNTLEFLDSYVTDIRDPALTFLIG